MYLCVCMCVYVHVCVRACVHGHTSVHITRSQRKTPGVLLYRSPFYSFEPGFSTSLDARLAASKVLSPHLSTLTVLKSQVSATFYVFARDLN